MFLDRRRRRALRSPPPGFSFRNRYIEPLEQRLMLSINWINPAGGAWDVAANWSGGAVPGNGDDAVINTAAPATITISSTDAESVRSLTTAANDTLAITGGSLTVAANSTLSGPLTMTGGSVTATGTGVNLTANGATTLSAASLFAQAGATLSLPLATGDAGTAVAQPTLQASGAGSVLSLAALTTLSADTTNQNSRTIVNALSGGHVGLAAVTTLSGPLQCTSDGAGSQVDLSAVTSFQGRNVIFDNNALIQVTGGGTLLDGALTNPDQVNVTLDGTGTLATSQWTAFTNATATVSGGTPDFSKLANILGAGFVVSGGATVALPAAATYSSTAGAQPTFQASGAGSVLSFAALTTLNADTSSGNSLIVVSALSGGHVGLGEVTKLNGPLQLTSDGAGSQVDLSAATSYQGRNVLFDNGNSLIQVTHSGTLLDGALTTLDQVNLTLDGTGTLATGQWTAFTNGTATISGGTLAFNNLENILGAVFLVSGGATVALPAVAAYSSSAGAQPTLQASGAGSVLSLPALTTLSADATNQNSRIIVNALSGGHVGLAALTTLSGPLQCTSDGTGSQLDLSKATNFQGRNVTYDNNSSIQVTHGGTLLDGALTTLDQVNLTSDGTGTLATSQWTAFTNATATISGGTPDFNNLANILDASFLVSGGATVALPAVAAYSSTAGAQPMLQASGAGSVLSFAALATLGADTTGQNSRIVVNALSGGHVGLAALTTLSGPLQCTSDGAGSQLDLSAATSFQGRNVTYDNNSSIQVTKSGTLLDGALTTLDQVNLTLDGTGTLAAGQWTAFTNATATISGGTPDFSKLANIMDASFLVSGGANVALPAVAAYSSTAGAQPTLQASGAGSVLSFAALTTLSADTTNQNSRIIINALSGGHVGLAALTTLSGPAQLTSDGTGSQVDLSAATSFQGRNVTYDNNSSIQVTGGGTLLDGALTTLDDVSLTVSGGSYTLPNLAHIDGSSITVSGGATLSLPAVTSFSGVVGGTSTLEATGAGSTLSLPNLATITEAANSTAQLEALAGGTLAAQALKQISTGQVLLVADGANSVLDLSSLPSIATGTPQVTNGGKLIDLVIATAPAGSPPTIVVGRTLSAYDVPTLQNNPAPNNQETITFTVYNQAADPISGVLLTDTLASGVTFATASQLPDQIGQQLAWSLGTIQPYDRASVTLTVSLATPTPTQLDTGAAAYGTLDAGLVSWTTVPATLRSTAIAADLLASTPDANTTDPYVQEKAAELNYDPRQIFNFLQTQIGYNSYVGSLRGARGTLWSSAGNSLDDANLGIALMRASGIPAQYEEGTLTVGLAQQLILSMFPASYQTVGYIPAGTQLSDPANDQQLLAETETHFWFQFDSGAGMLNADPEFAGQTISQAATTSTNSFTEVPDNLRQKTEVSLTAEIYNQGAAALTGGSGLSQTVVLDQTFNDVDLVGRPLTVGNFVNSSGGGGAGISSETNTYSPYLEIGDDAFPDNSTNKLIRGADFQEVLTTFPFGSQVLTGLFLNITLSGAGTQSQTFAKTLYDRIGYATRENGGAVTATLTAPQSISALDLTTLVISAASEPASVLTARQAELATLSSELSTALAAATGAGQGGTQAAAVDTVNTFAQQVRAQSLAVFGSAFLAASAELSARTQAIAFTSAYFASPRIVAVTGSDTSGSSSPQSSDELDLVRDSARVVVAPGQPASVEQVVNLTRGWLDSDLEAQVMGGSSSSSASSSFGVFSQALGDGIPLSFITKANVTSLGALPLSAEAKARITQSVLDGLDVLTPSSMVQLSDGSSTVAWLQLDSSDGDSIFVSANGGHDAIVEYGGLKINIPQAVLEEQVSIEEADLAGEAEAQNLVSMIQKAKKAANNGSKPIGIGEPLAPVAPDIASELAQLLPHSEGNLVLTVFKSGLILAIRVAELDPPLPDFVLQPSLNSRADSAIIRGGTAPTIEPGSVSGTVQVGNTVARGALSASWGGEATSSFVATSLRVTAAAVKDASDNLIGDGSLSLLAAGGFRLAMTGTVSYNVTGSGSLSFYGPAENDLGVSGNWSKYTATVTGNVSLTLTVPAGALALNGKPLPAGTYTVTTSAATLSGSGTTSSPDFAGSASIMAASGAVELGPGSGNLSVGTTAINTGNEATLTGYNGTIDVSANGNGTDAVTLSGNAAGVLTAAPRPAALTTDQNTAVSFDANVQTSFADTYNLTANAPTGWAVMIDDTGKVNVTPATGTQGGTYPVQVIAQSTMNPELISQATVEVTVAPTTRGMMFAVNPDPVFTVPFGNAQVPSAFRATMKNTGPEADTYNLAFSTIPAGFTLLDSGTSVTVPAGQTGVLGLYLQPTGATLPAVGTQVSFTVTATSATDPSMAQTVNVSFTMPAIAAATVTSDPSAVATTPGTATMATITITNVGNVPYNAALATTTNSGLTVSGLTTPGMIPVGQSVTETATLTPDASTPLNTTLNATVNVDQAATQSVVSVVSVRAAAVLAGGTPTPQGQGFAIAGQSVDVSADVQSAVSQTEQGEASFTVTNGQGNTVFSSTAVPVTLSTIGSMATVDLGTFSTTGLTPGEFTINVTIADSGRTPIAGATDTSTMAVSLPVSANLSVDSDSQTPGPVTCTETLNITSNAVLGNVATDSTAQSVAVNPGAPGLAYVANSQDISIVDISNPSSPTVLSTFGSKDINQGGFNLARVAGGDLVVASQDLTYASAVKVLVYSLANPQSPTLVGSATVPYDTLIGMTIQGTTAYISTVGLQYDANGDSVTAQAGELVAVDFSNPAMPTVAGALYNDLPQPLGHDTNVWQAVPVNSQTLYVASSTSTGPDVQTGTGRVLIVNTADAGNMSVAGELDIPGTVQAVGIAVDGTHALVVGSSGGWISPFGNFSNVGLSGNVTLTLLDITNPASPTIIGTTVVTQNTFAAFGASPAGTIQALDLGNGQFAISGTLSNGSPVVLTVDASDLSSLATSNLPVNSDVNGLSLSNGALFGASSGGLTVYQAAALDTIATTVTVIVPTSGVSIVPNSFSLAPTSTASGANSETLTWNLNLTPGENQQITWQTNIANLQAEQVQPVATVATVQFTAPGSPPRSVGATVAANVAGVPTPVSVSVPVEVAAPGVPAIESAAVAAQQLKITGLSQQLNDLGIALTNLVETPTSNVYLSQALAALASLITLVTNDPFLSSYAAGLTTAQSALSAATTPADLQTAITNLGTALDSLAQAITDYALYGFTLSLASIQALALPGAATLYNVQLQNTGSQSTTYDFSVSGLPAGVTGTFSQSSITLAPGASIPQGTTVVTLSLSQSGSSLVGGTFTVTATAEGANEIALGTQGQLTLLAESLSVPVVTITPPFTQPGGQVDVAAKIQSVVNEPHALSASFTVADPNGNVIYTDPSPQTVPLTITSGLTTVDLGNIDTTGFADGVDTVTVTVTDSSSPPGVPAILPTAAGQANLTIGLPVTATISTNPPALPENTVAGPLSVTTTLSVDAETPFPDPLTLDGQVQTTPAASDVTLYQSGGNNLAYVSGTNGIDIVDVSNPAAPVDKGAFGTGDIVKGGSTIGRIATLGGVDYLIVGTSATLNANYFTLLIYSLANPLAPSKVSGTAFDYEFMDDLLIDGTTLIVPTAGLYFFAGGLEDEYGTVLSIDISNPAAPVLKGELYNNRGMPEGGDTQQIGGIVVQSGLAYITSTTETGGGGFTFNSGVGRVLVVDDSNPASLAVSKEVDIPGTAQGLSIGIQGHQALVASSTGGPFGTLSNYGQVSGHLVLSLMDVSNPASPTLIGTSLITGDTFGTTASNTGGDISVVPLGNGLYAVSGAVDNGASVLLLVDPTDPNNIVVSATPLPVGGNGMDVSGDILYATSSQGLTTYQIGTIAHTSYTASVEVPTAANTSIVSGSYNIPPTSITTGTNFDTLTWVRQLAFGQDQQTFSWQTDVQSVNGGEVRPVTLGTSVSFVSQATPGSLSLSGTSVTGIPIAQIFPASQTVVPGDTLTFDLRLSNPLNEIVDYHLQPIIEFNFTHSTVPLNNVTVQPNSTVDVPFQVTSNINDLPGTIHSEIIVTGGIPPSDDYGSGESAVAPFTVVFAGTPVIPTPDAHGVAINVTPAKASAGPDGIAKYTVQVTNTGSVDDFFSLAISGPGAQNAGFSQSNEIEIPPGASRDATLTLAPAAFVESPGDYPFTVTATAVLDNPPFSASANGTLTVLGPGVYVNLTPTTSSTAPGAPYQVVLVNVGTTSDTFNLSLAGPAAQAASLATQSVTLAVGGSTTVNISTSAADFADAGNLPLTVIATSQANPAVQGASTADLSVPSTQSVTAAFDPSTQTLAAPGATSFLLQVNNTGNTEDSYSATITGASFNGTGGPITASLIGLDGQPAQSVPLFILPGLSQGAILLQVTGAGPGQGTVTVTIQSLTNADENTTATATLNIAAPVQMQVTLSTNSGLSPVEGTTTTITKSVLEAAVSGVETPAGGLVFTLTSVPTNGSLLLSGQALAIGATFTQDDINSGRLAYKSVEEGADSFGFNVAASGATGAGGTFLIATSDPAVAATGGFTVTAAAGTDSASQTVATFSDPGGSEALADFAATIAWGDGTSSAGTITFNTATALFTVTGDHTYASAGTEAVAVTIAHEASPPATVQSTAVVAAVATHGVSISTNTGLALAEGASATITSGMLQATVPGVTMPAAELVFTLTSVPTNGSLLLSGQALATGATFTQDDINNGHLAYQAVEEGADSFGFNVAAIGATGASGTFLIATSDPAVAAAGGFTITAAAGTDSASQTVATFSDPGGSEALADYAATIAWGDGTSSAGTITFNTATALFTVTGDHTYASAGTEAVAVTLTHEASPPVTVQSTAVVSAAVVESLNVVGIEVRGFELSPLTGVPVATFTAPTGLAPGTQFSATIDWGDGATSSGTVSLTGTTFTIAGSHTYGDERVWPVSVAITGAGLSANVSTHAKIDEELLPDGTQGTANQRYIQEIYRDVLHREVDQGGLDFWTAKLDAGESHGQLAYDIVRLAFPREEQQDEVQSLYETYLHRAPEPVGLQFWTAFLYDGGTDEQLAEDLVSSPEYLQTRGGGTNDGFLDALYGDALGRAVDAAARTYFDAAMANGATRAAVAALIFGSDEYRRELVSGWYEQFLDRPADPLGVAAFAAQLAAGQSDEQIIAEFVSSDEYFAKTAVE